jgi:hypothetical protein
MTVAVTFTVGDHDHEIELDDDYPNATYRKGEQIVAEIEACGYEWTANPPGYGELANLSRTSPLGRIDLGDVSDRVGATGDVTTEG